MKTKPFFFAIGILIANSAHAGNGGTTVIAVLQSAMVYRNAAELSHIAKATLVSGNNDLVIGNISNAVDESSIHIHCNQAITVMSVSFSKEYLQPATKSAVVKKLEDSIYQVKKQLSGAEIMLKSDNELLELLRANKEVRGTQTGLSVAELVKMMDYYKQKSLDLQNELAVLKEKQKKWNDAIDDLDHALEEEEKKNSNTSGKLLLQLLVATEGTYEFTVSYVTPSASWNPLYDIRVNSINDPLKLVYKAKLVQTSGIDWKGIKLSLFTSVPDQHGIAPLLKTWFLRYVDPLAGMVAGVQINTIPFLSSVPPAEYHLNEVVVRGYGLRKKSEDKDEDASPIYIVNGLKVEQDEFEKIDPRVIKNIRTVNNRDTLAMYGKRDAGIVTIVTLKDELSDYVSVTDNQLNVVFDIDIPYDVPGNGKEQQVVLKEYATPALYKYYAVPKADHDAYLLGEVRDWEKLNLLPGEANIIFEGTYAGKTIIDPNSTQDTLNLSLGKDKRVVVKREKLTDFSSTHFLGGNRKQVFTFETTVKNNKKEKITMILKDQYPISSTKEIESLLLESSDASVNEETGVLTWKIELAPGETKKLRMSYSVKYPKNKTVNTE